MTRRTLEYAPPGSFKTYERNSRTHKLGRASGRQRVCISCSGVDIVRQDNHAVMCAPCSTKTTAQRRKKAKQIPLKLGRKRGRRIPRVCKNCHTGFEVLACTLSGKTNASGNFCSRSCYDAWLHDPLSSASRGPGWHAIRTQALGANPFCALCARPNRLDVHHIVPYRVTRDNGQDNLVPLCRRHHKIVEEVTRDVLGTGLDPELAKIALGSMLREHQAVSALAMGVALGRP